MGEEGPRGLLLGPAQSTGLAPPQPPLQRQHIPLRLRCCGSLPNAYLHVDFPPVLVCELTATLSLQLLQNAAVYGQAAVDFRKELFYVRVEGAQDAVTDLCELRTQELGASFMLTGPFLAEEEASASGVPTTSFSWLPSNLCL